ncbi:hypothetical protein [Methylotuvimicrobium alcaliphilum]|uniref:Antitoxin n=1 Tax=Methylotuvimicrobium alcaliphilum (strain DSM 19304 / NCIMB 14124 / VKM B-2133 / 20Z) TaxID=1091494 RepID=G4T216_META2|nr:hypothetical protein [Methylotuvimicrobium alcaliphilum]CCE25708.1 conserved protein of unknown function [Methylotuvimicrobium alcaliphilum 20Z]
MKIQPQYITNAAGEKISVVLSLDDYEEMLEDLAAIAERKDEPSVAFDEAIKALTKNRTCSIALYSSYIKLPGASSDIAEI